MHGKQKNKEETLPEKGKRKRVKIGKGMEETVWVEMVWNKVTKNGNV